MARRSKAQQDKQDQVAQRLTSDTPLTVEATAQVAGKKGSASSRTRQVVERHPSLESLTGSLAESGLQGGTVTTNSGLQVKVSRQKGRSENYNPQAPEFGNEAAPPVRETGGTPMLRTQIGNPRLVGEPAQKAVAEAEKMRAGLEAKATSGADGILGAVAALQPSVGGNYTPGVASRVAGLDNVRFAQSTAAMRPANTQGPNPLEGGRASRRAGTSVRPVFESSHEMVAHGLGYTEGVQNQMLQTARGSVAAKHAASPQGQSRTQREAAAQGMVQEHIDTAIRGTNSFSKTPLDMAKQSLSEHIEGGSLSGMGIEQAAPRGTAAPTGSLGAQELGNSPRRTPEQEQGRGFAKTVASMTKSPELQEHIEDVGRDHAKVMAKEGRIRSRRGVEPQDRSTWSGSAAQNTTRARGQAQFVTSNNDGISPGETTSLNSMANALDAQGQKDAASHVREIGLARSRQRAGVGVTPEPGKKVSVTTMKPLSGTR